MRARTLLAGFAAVVLSLGGVLWAAPPAAGPVVTPKAVAKSSALPNVTPLTPVDPFSLTAEKYTLPSGMTVLLRRDSSVPRVVVSLWFAVGSRDEAPGKTGFAHLYEHLMFMGTKNVPGNRFDVAMESEGGGNNATTSADRTFYFDFGPSHILPTLLWLEADRLTHLPETMTDEKVALQREVVRNERRQAYENRPYGQAELRIPGAMYPAGHPYSWPVIGSHEDLVAASTQDVKQFFYKHYTPSNATLAVVGDFNPEEARRLIQHYFGWMPRRPKPVSSVQGMQEMVVPVSQSLTVEDQVTLPRVYVVWHAPSVANPQFPLSVLVADMLGKGKSSVLYRKLVVEQKLAQSVEAEVDPQQLGSILSLVVTAQPGVPIEQLEKAVDIELAAVGNQPPRMEDITRARNVRLTDWARELETPLGQSQWLQQLHAYLEDANALAKMVGVLRGATPQTVQTHIADVGIGQRGRRLHIRVIPRKGEPAPVSETVVPTPRPFDPTGRNAKGQPAPQPMRPTVDLTKPPKMLLARTPISPQTGHFRVQGVDVTLVERKGTQLIETVIAIPAGEADVQPAKSGLSEGVAAMLSEGSVNRPGTTWVQAMEAVGANFKIVAGSDTTLVTMGVLSQNHAEASSLLFDALLRPQFEERTWVRVRAERLAALEQKKNEPAFVAERVLRASLFGAQEPYGRSPLGNPGAVANLGTSDLRAFHRSFYAPKQWKIVLAGDFVPSQAVAERLLSSLQQGASAQTSAPPVRPVRTPPKTQRGVVLVDKKGAPQSEIRFATVVPGAMDPDRGTLDVANVLWGGMFTSRLNQNLRETHGYTYGIRSQFVRMDGVGVWAAGAAVRSDVTAESVVEIRKEALRLVNEPCSMEELARSRNATIQRLTQLSERTAGLAQLFATFSRNRLPPDEWTRMVGAAQTVTTAKLLEATRLRLRPAEATIVIVGDAEKLLPSLSKLMGLSPQQISRRDTNGLPLTQ